MTPTIRAALDASVRAYCCADGECPCGHYSACLIAPNPDTRDGMAKAIAAFLRALPVGLPSGDDASPYRIGSAALQAEWAAAVEEAAKEAGDDNSA
jgi:hypothetical protein